MNLKMNGRAFDYVTIIILPYIWELDNNQLAELYPITFVKVHFLNWKFSFCDQKHLQLGFLE